MEESDGGESVVADSEESDRTPSPSILGGLDLLNRKTLVTDVDDVSSDDKHHPVTTTSKQNDTASGINEDDEQRRGNFSSRTGLERSYSPAASDPFFKKVKHYYHSPVFTPPRKLFRPANSKLGDKIETEVSQGPSTMILPVGAGVTDVSSQILFSDSQDSSMSQSLSIKHKECAKSAQDKGFPNPTCSTSNNIFWQSINCKGTLGELVRPTESGPKSDRPVVSQLAQIPSDSGTTHKPSVDRKLKEGSHSDEQPDSGCSIVSDCIAVDNMHTVGSDNNQVEKDIQDMGTLPSDSLFLQESGCKESALKVLFQSCDGKEPSISLSSGTPSSASAPKSTISEAIESSHLSSDLDKIWNSSKQDDSNSLNSLEEEYKALNTVVEKGGISLTPLKDKLKKLQQAMKDEAEKIQQQRGHIISCDPEKMSESQQQLQKQELLNLSRKQKHLLHILNIHKRVASNLSSKEMEFHAMGVPYSQRVILPSNATNDKTVLQTWASEMTPGMHVQAPSTMKTKEVEAVENPSIPVELTDETEQEKDGTQDIDSETSQLSQSASVRTPMPQLIVKDLIANGLLEPSKGCMSFVYKGRQVFGDLQLDGSILSEDVYYKNEKEWFTTKCGQPASSIRKPKLWNLIKYDDKPLKAFADQCQLLSIAKKIEVPKAATTETVVVALKEVYAERASSLKPTAKVASYAEEKKLHSRGLFDPTVIKSVVLIGDNELFTEDELLTNGFWDNRGSQGSSIPLQWLKEISSWED